VQVRSSRATRAGRLIERSCAWEQAGLEDIGEVLGGVIPELGRGRIEGAKRQWRADELEPGLVWREAIGKTQQFRCSRPKAGLANFGPVAAEPAQCFSRRACQQGTARRRDGVCIEIDLLQVACACRFVGDCELEQQELAQRLGAA
jgi:hypothetical protein